MPKYSPCAIFFTLLTACGELPAAVRARMASSRDSHRLRKNLHFRQRLCRMYMKRIGFGWNISCQRDYIRV